MGLMRFKTRASAASAAVLASLLSTHGNAADMFGADATDWMLDARPAEMWTGPYLGVQLGYGWTHLEATNAFATVTGVGTGSLPLTGFSTDRDEINGGGTIGYNLYTSSMVLGVEADVSAGDYVFDSGQRAVSNVLVAGDTLSGHFKGGFDAFGTIRARAGLLLAPRTLLYATGGLAIAHTKSSIAFTYNDGSGPISSSFSDENFEWGYAIGGGIEDKFADALSMKLEYLFIGLNDSSFEFSQPGVTFGYDGKAYMHLVRLGLNYAF